jgi:hypothetical protein
MLARCNVQKVMSAVAQLDAVRLETAAGFASEIDSLRRIRNCPAFRMSSNTRRTPLHLAAAVHAALDDDTDPLRSCDHFGTDVSTAASAVNVS